MNAHPHISEQYDSELQNARNLLMEMGGIEKMLFGSGSGDTDDLKDHGVVTGYFAAVADS